MLTTKNQKDLKGKAKLVEEVSLLEENQVVKLNLANEIIREVKFNDVLEKKLEELKAEKIKVAYQQYPEWGTFSQIISLFDKSNSLERENAERNALMEINYHEVLAIAVASFETTAKQLEVWAGRAVENVIESNELLVRKISLELVKNKTMLIEQEELINSLTNELETSNTKVSELELELSESKNNLEAETQRINEFFRTRNLANFQTIVIENLESLMNVEGPLSTDEQKIQDLSLEIRRLGTIVRSSRITISLLRANLNEARRKLEQWVGYSANWQKERSELKEAMAEITKLDEERLEIFNKTSLENARLSSKIIELEATIEQGKSLVDKLNVTIENKNKQIKNLGLRLRRENCKKKVLTASNWIRYGTAWLVNEKTQDKIDITLTSWSSYYVLKDLDNWSYEVLFMILGVVVWRLLKKSYNWWKGPKEVIFVREVMAERVVKEETKENLPKGSLTKEKPKEEEPNLKKAEGKLAANKKSIQ